mmetsp:Transcript_8033/g.23564  ORF Transcript_8033/g.23564 Transcript_8033/m.23564 type:complete len:345 (-) Transcript_8033:1729-2763(-)
MSCMSHRQPPARSGLERLADGGAQLSPRGRLEVVRGRVAREELVDVLAHVRGVRLAAHRVEARELPLDGGEGAPRVRPARGAIRRHLRAERAHGGAHLLLHLEEHFGAVAPVFEMVCVCALVAERVLELVGELLEAVLQGGGVFHVQRSEGLGRVHVEADEGVAAREDGLVGLVRGEHVGRHLGVGGRCPGRLRPLRLRHPDLRRHVSDDDDEEDARRARAGECARAAGGLDVAPHGLRGPSLGGRLPAHGDGVHGRPRPRRGALAASLGHRAGAVPGACDEVLKRFLRLRGRAGGHRARARVTAVRAQRRVGEALPALAAHKVRAPRCPPRPHALPHNGRHAL